MKPRRKAQGTFMSQIPDKLLPSEAAYRNIFEAASDGLVIYDIGLDSVNHFSQPV
jgi:hypothetical protein